MTLRMTNEAFETYGRGVWMTMSSGCSTGLTVPEMYWSKSSYLDVEGLNAIGGPVAVPNCV
eukprot:1736149-Pleurochrysis_carterae.AAC.2